MKNAEKRKKRKEKKKEKTSTKETPPHAASTKKKRERTLATKKRFKGGALFIRSKAELKLRKRILLEIIKTGWAVSSELYLMRANTSSVCLGMMAALSRMHLLMSSENNGQGRFGSWLLV